MKTEKNKKVKSKEPAIIEFKTYSPNFISFSLMPWVNSGLSLEELQSMQGTTFSINTTNQIFLEANIIALITTFGIFGDEEKKHQFSEIVIHHQFEIGNLKSHLISKEDEQVRFNKTFLATLVGIALSTSRGMIKVKLEGSYLANPILPILDPMKLVKE